MNFIAAEFVSSNVSDVTVRLDDGALIHCAVSASAAKPGDKVTLGIRPEHITRVPYNRLTAQVTFVESLGSVTYAYCALPGVQDDLTCELTGVVRVQAGDILERRRARPVLPVRCIGQGIQAHGCSARGGMMQRLVSMGMAAAAMVACFALPVQAADAPASDLDQW